MATQPVMQEDKLERKLKAVKIQLMRTPQFALWSGILMVGATHLVDNIETAMTNGRDEFYGRKFVEQLSPKELAFVILHENLHKALRHMIIWKMLYKIDPQLANIACDHVINLMLVDMDPTEKFLVFPKWPKGHPKAGHRMGCYDERFRGMNSKQVFDILREEQKQQPPQGDKGKGEKGDQQGQGGGAQSQSNSNPDGFDEHDWDGASDFDEKEKQELERELDQAIRQGQIAHQKACGNKAGDQFRELGDLMEPQIDWREVLREFVSASCRGLDTSSWRRVNRRFLHTGMYMPSMIGEKVGPIVVGIDTSGSIGAADLNRFLSEIKAICDTVRPERIDLIYWDAKVASHEVYDDANMDTLVTSTQPKGGGGTDPTCVMNYIDEQVIKPEAIIMLTDGEIGRWGDKWTAPILWVVCNQYRREKIYAPCGKTVHLEADQD